MEAHNSRKRFCNSTCRKAYAVREARKGLFDSILDYHRARFESDGQYGDPDNYYFVQNHRRSRDFVHIAAFGDRKDHNWGVLCAPDSDLPRGGIGGRWACTCPTCEKLWKELFGDRLPHFFSLDTEFS